ncbi:MAG: hypothetical protein LBK03_04310 [Bacteroidales bacterium]|jgi:mannosyltransferase OCH1-like enzyme|nr:hypothetical protein [Bacteroidales bacterium]
MKIPKIIHQIWAGDQPLSIHFAEYGETWKKHHPGWQYELWNRQRTEDFVKAHYPQYVDAYHNFPYPIQQWDAIRYLILNTLGGLYVDFDTECLRPCDDLLADGECFFALEPEEHARVTKRPFLVSNAFMASIPHHPFMRKILDTAFIPHNPMLESNPSSLVLQTTGPIMVSRCYDRYPDKQPVCLLPSVCTAPFTAAESCRYRLGERSGTLIEKLSKAYAVHYFYNTWAKSMKQNEQQQDRFIASKIHQEVIRHETPITVTNRHPIHNKICIFTMPLAQHYSSSDDSLSKLIPLLENSACLKAVSNGGLAKIQPSVMDALLRMESRNYRCHSMEELAITVLKEMIHWEHYRGEEIPRIIHHFWAGGKLSHIAMSNIFAWMDQTEKYQWKHLLWTDRRINSQFSDQALNRQLETLSQANLEVLDVAEDAPDGETGIREAYDILIAQVFNHKKSALPYISDMVRYTKLFEHGGVYVDIDIHPGDINLSKSLRHRSASSDIPLLSPCIRTRHNARALGYYDTRNGQKEVALVTLYNRQMLNNNFIATKPQNHIMKSAVQRAAQKIVYTREKGNGPSDLINSVLEDPALIKEKNRNEIIAECIPTWLFDINWVTDESDQLVI